MKRWTTPNYDARYYVAVTLGGAFIVACLVLIFAAAADAPELIAPTGVAALVLLILSLAVDTR